MKNILIHGLGQNETSWSKVETELEHKDIIIEKPNLYSMIKNTNADYDVLFNKFADWCNSFENELNLCGLSLGGILALEYAKKFPHKVKSLILIGTPYKIPKFLFKIQGVVFHLMPQTSFEKMGYSKKDFISLVNSMSDLDIASDLTKIQCKTLILCGANDKQNMDGAKLLNENIRESTFKTVEKSSHEVNVDNPKELSNMICGFWESLV